MSSKERVGQVDAGYAALVEGLGLRCRVRWRLSSVCDCGGLCGSSISVWIVAGSHPTDGQFARQFFIFTEGCVKNIHLSAHRYISVSGNHGGGGVVVAVEWWR